MNWAAPGLLSIDAKFEATTRRLLPDPVVGALLGFLVGYMAANSFSFLGMDTPRFLALAVGVFGAMGGWVGGVLRQGPSATGRNVAWWCFTMTIIVGFTSFIIGFIACVLFVPGNRSPMLVYFVIGPLGAVLGAATGVIIGLGNYLKHS